MRETLHELLGSGAFVVAGYNRQGHPVFEMTQVMEDFYPHIYEDFVRFNEQLVETLWFKDMVQLTMNNDGTMSIKVRDDLTQQELSSLPEPERRRLLMIMAWQEEE